MNISDSVIDGRASRPALIFLLSILMPVSSATSHDAARNEAAASVPLYSNLGSHHHPITTAIPRTQDYFDQGLRLVFAFNHDEAIRAFSEAARLDPDCAMCYWGSALALGPHINAKMDAASAKKAYSLVQRAVSLVSRASKPEQAYIRALAQRYARQPPTDRSRLDHAYARAMADVVQQFPDDLDAATLYAEALMDLRPWNYWTPDGRPQPGTTEILTLLEGVIARDPHHPGACHYYIHAVEAVSPEKALACAERLAKLMPGAGHMVHMPAHIYVRVGRYADAVESNRHAVHTDEDYIADQRPTGLYPLAYYPHNYHFLAFAATMAGRSAEAIEAARALTVKVTPAVAEKFPELEALVPYLPLILVTFGRWDEVLAEPLPSDRLRFANAMTHYARGVAFAAKSKVSAAHAALNKVRRASAAMPEGTNKSVLKIAANALAGEIAARQGRLNAPIAHFKRAMELEDRLPYTEPPFWFYPLRHSLGKALLAAGRPEEAETVYREDLKRFPENGWALHGLEMSLRAQGRTAQAAEIAQRFRRAWSGADILLSTSRF